MEPLPSEGNRVYVAVRPGMEGMLSVEPCICSSLRLPLLARIKALHSNVSPIPRPHSVILGLE